MLASQLTPIMFLNNRYAGCGLMEKPTMLWHGIRRGTHSERMSNDRVMWLYPLLSRKLPMPHKMRSLSGTQRMNGGHLVKCCLLTRTRWPNWWFLRGRGSCRSPMPSLRIGGTWSKEWISGCGWIISCRSVF